MYNKNSSTFNFHQLQYFSLPFGTISYIAQNPISANGLLKLQKTCKYFFAKNKIILVDENIIQNNNTLVYSFTDSRKSRLIREKNKIKYWFNSTLTIEKSSIDKHEFKLSKCIYRCSLYSLKIYNRNISLKDFDFLMYDSDVKMSTLVLINVNIYDENGERVSIDKILENLPNMENLDYHCKNEIFTKGTFERMCLLKFQSKYKEFNISISKISDDADITLLCDFIKNIEKDFNTNSSYNFWFRKRNLETYKQTLKIPVEEMLKKWNSTMKPSICVY